MQRVQRIVEMSDDESSASGPPDLEDIEGESSDSEDDEGPPDLLDEDDENSGSESSDSDSIPPLQNDDGDSDQSDYSEDYDEDDDDSSGQPEASDDEGPPKLIGSDDDDAPPDLDDPSDDSDDESSEEEMPGLEVDSQDASDDDTDSAARQRAGTQQPGIAKGFLNAKKKSNSSSSYSNAGVGQREEGAAAAAARARAASSRSTQYAGTGAGAREDLRAEPHPYGRGRGGMTPDESADFMRPGGPAGMPGGPSSSNTQRARATQQQQWATNQPKREKKKKVPEPAPSSEPAKPAEVVVDREAILAREREMEELRRRLQMARDETNAAPVPVGRCCLNRGLADAPANCLKDPVKALVWPAEKRMQMKCSAGCNIVWHQECWRRFQEGYEQEMRNDKECAYAGNIIHALKIRDKSKPPLVPCVTPGCPGYINFLGIFEGPPGHESFKNPLFGPTQEQAKLIREAQDAARAAAKEAVAQARLERKAAADAAALQSWRSRLNRNGEPNWKPKGLKKPRNKPSKPQQEPLANGTATNKRSSAIDDELMQFLEKEGAVTKAVERDAAAKAAEAAEAVAEKKPGGITVKRAIKPIVLRRQQVKVEEPEEAGSPSAASVEGSASASQSASLPASSKEPDPLEQLGKVRLSDHVDRTYHTSVQDMVAQEIPAAPEVGRKGKKKKGITMHLDQLLAVVPDQEPNVSGSSRQAQQRQQQRQQQQEQEQQQPQQPRLADFPSLDQAAAMGTQAVGAETDYLMEALNRLKIGVSEIDTSPHVLLQCVDFYMMRKNEVDPQQHLSALILSKTGEQPVYTWLFEQQEAIAVTMSSTEKALLLYMYLNNYHLFRKPLKPSYLRQPPYDDVLHEACAQYETAAMRLEREQREALQEAGVVSDVLPIDKMNELMNKVMSGAISQAELLQQIQEESQKQSQGGSNASPLQQQDTQQKQRQTQNAKQQQGEAGSSSGAAAAAAAAPPAVTTAVAHAAKKVVPIVDPRLKQQVPPPRPPPGEPPAQQQQQRGAIRVMYSHPPHMVPVVQQPVMLHPQPVLVPQMGFGMVPVVTPPPYGMPIASMPVLPMMQPVVMQGVVQPPPPHQQQQTWQQQQQQMLSAQRRQQQQQVAADGDWAGDDMLHNDDRTSYWDDGHEVAVDQDEAGSGHDIEDSEAGDEQQQQKQPSHVRKLAAAAAGADGGQTMSGSPATKLNPLAKEFKIPGISTTPPPSRLQNGSSSNGSSAAAADTTAQSASGSNGVSKDSSAAAAAGEGDATSTEAVADNAEKATAVEEAAATTAAPAPSEQGTAAAAAVQQQPAAAAAAAAAEAPASGSSSSASDSTAAAATNSSSSRASSSSGGSLELEPVATQPERQDASSQPAATVPPAAAVSSSSSSSRAYDLPADHVFDVVHLAGCNNMYLQQTFRNPNTPAFTLPHTSFTDSHKIATSQSGGLIMYNVDTGLVEGLWVAFNNTPEGVQWRSVATYAEVPREVYASLLQLQPFKNHYPGEQGMSIIKAIWRWAHPQPPAAVAAAAAASTPALPLPAAAAANASMRTSSSGGATAQQQQPASAPSSRPGSSGPAFGADAGSGGGRALPPLLAMLANRPGSAGNSNSGAAPPPPAAAAATEAKCEAALPPARPPARPQPGRKLCTICQANASGWLVFGCKHMGPCVECCPRPATMTQQDKFYTDPPGYPRCLFPGCDKPVKQLFRVVM